MEKVDSKKERCIICAVKYAENADKARNFIEENWDSDKYFVQAVVYAMELLHSASQKSYHDFFNA